MTTIEHLSRSDAVAERDSLLFALREKFGTGDRNDLRGLGFAGALSDEEIDSVERIRSLDFLLGE